MAALHAAAFVSERAWAAQEFENLLAQPGVAVAHAPHGFALWRAVAGEAELLTIAVDPAHQGQGIGARLMHDWMEAAGVVAQDAFLEVAADNTAACALYAAFGFETVGRRTGYYLRPTTRTDALLMRATLRP